MKGKYSIVISNSRIKYHIEIERNISIIKGYSGTGKSTLYTMFYDLLKSNRNSGIKCNCREKLRILTLGANWENEIKSVNDKIFIADEYIDYVQTKEFASIAQSSGNYFIIISRSGRLKWLTYSVNSIYELKTEKEGDIFCTKLYKRYFLKKVNLVPDVIITEDSNSGYEMITSLVKCDVLSARGRDNIYNELIKNFEKYNMLYVIVDGAAFGSCIDRIAARVDNNSKTHIFAPESFEFLLLGSSTFKRYLTTELDRTYNFCDSSLYLSWERYYTDLLSGLCERYYSFSYRKSKLNKMFQSDFFKKYIRSRLIDLDITIFKEI